MKLQYCSDLHLEFALNEQFIKKHPIQVLGNILLLAGDIMPFTIMDKHKDFFDFVADNFEHTYWVPGNHEYYHTDIGEKGRICNEKIRNNISIVNNVTITIDDVQLICSTLWSKINPLNEQAILRAMSDFHLITHKGSRFSIPVFNQLYADSVAFIEHALTESLDTKKVIVTHHIPTYKQYPQKYKNGILSEAFASELYDLIESSGARSWVYGHHLINTPDFKIGETLLLTNQLGYVKHGENHGFDSGKVIDI